MAIKTVTKIWGREEWLANNELYCLKKMIVIPRGCCSLHAHPKKDETFYMLIGKMFLEIGGNSQIVFPGHSVRIFPMTKHRFSVDPYWREAVFLEVSTHHDDNDVIRYEPSKLL